MLRKPLIRHIAQTPYGMQVHPTEPMRYGTSDKALKQTGQDAGYEIPITHYAFRRWTGNEANRKSPQKSQKGQPDVCS
jgi:tRNA(Leu) C34 or U34 (ribose-2'-O)-methylase TrmL